MARSESTIRVRFVKTKLSATALGWWPHPSDIIGMTLRIERRASTNTVALQLIGNMRVEHFDEVKAEIRAAGTDVVVLDVSGLALVSVEGIRFLNACQDEGVAITKASPYGSEWMTLERNTGSKSA
jgi:hypothetical protein